MEEGKSNIIDNRAFFEGRMNLDLSPDFQKSGEYGVAQNINPVNYEGGFVGTITNVKGNTLIDYTFDGLAADPFIRVIGSHLDLKRRRVYVMVYGQNDSDEQFSYVLYYSYETDEITTVFSDGGVTGAGNPLEFDPNFTISNVNVIYDDELGDELYWTDANTEPKRLNVTAGVNRYNNYTTKTTGFLEGEIVFANGNQSIDNIRQFIPCRALIDTNDYPAIDYTTGELDTLDWETLPVGQCYPPSIINTLFYQRVATPYWSPNGTYRYEDGTEDAQGAATFLRRKSYQFAYAYVYYDGLQSELSPFSEAVLSQELTSGIFTIGEQTANPDFPTPLGIDVKVPIHSFRYTDLDDIESLTEFPHSMIARVKLFIREVPRNETPTDWLQWEDIPYDEFYKYNLSSSNISSGFPVSGDAGTYYYDWFSSSYAFSPSGESSQITTITVRYDGSQTLIPVDVKYASTNSYSDARVSTTQDIVDNRIVNGAVTDGLDVSNDVIQSIEDNVTITQRVSKPQISPTPTTTQINFFDPTPVITNNNSQIVTITWTLNQPFVAGDFSNFFLLRWNWTLAADVGLNSVNNTYAIQGSGDSVSNESDFQQILSEAIFSNAYGGDGWSINQVLFGGDELSVVLSGTSNINVSSSNLSNNEGFFEFDTYLPFRTYKNHSRQQFGFLFTDQLGRQTPVITGDWATIDFGHFYDGSFDVNVFSARINNLADISVPSDVRSLNIVRKRSDSWRNFAQFAISSTNTFQESWNWDKPYSIGFENLEIDSSINSSFSSNKNLYITLNSINGGDGLAYSSLFDTSVLNFVPQTGDVIRFLYKTDTDGNVDEIYNSSFNISRYDERTNSIVLDFGDIEQNEPNLATYLEDNFQENSEWTVRVLCEVIQKPTQSDQEFYWETAAQLSVTDGAIDINQTSGFDQISLFGDSYLKLRGYCVNYNGSSPDVFQNFVLQDPNFNDFSETANTGQGRPNQQLRSLRRGQNEYVEVTRDNLLRYSEKSIQNTDVRRYNQYFDENIQEVDNIYGKIEKIHASGDELNIYQEDKMSRVYVGRSVTTELRGDQRIIASQNNVFSDVVYNSFSGGISIDRDSFATRGYQKYFTDSKRGAVYRQSLDGITPISEVGMSGFFKDIFRRTRNSFVPPIIKSAIDERTDEYMLSITYSEDTEVTVISGNSSVFTFKNPDDGVDYTAFAEGQQIFVDPSGSAKFTPTALTIGANETSAGIVTVNQNPSNLLTGGEVIRVSYPKNKTLIWSERTNGWTTFVSMTPEWLESGIQSYNSFFNGDTYIHDIGNTDYNTFFGTLYDSSIELFGNKLPTLTKYWRNLQVKTKADTLIVNEGDILTSEEQVSHIPSAIFENREGSQFAYFLGEGTGTEVNSGNKLRGRWIKVNLTIPSNSEDNQEFKIFDVSFLSGESGLTY